MKYIKLFEEKSVEWDHIKRDKEIRSFAQITKTGDIAKKIYEMLERDCKPYLDELRSQKLVQNVQYNFLHRFHRNDLKIDVITPRKDRRPRDTHVKTHNLLDDIFQEFHGEKPRREGVFVTNDPSYESGGEYDNIFFPIGNYKYLYHEKVKDLFPFMIASGAGVGEQAQKYIDEKGLDITVEELKYANYSYRVNLSDLTNFPFLTDFLVDKGVIERGKATNQVSDETINKIKEWAEKTLRIFLNPLISEYKSEGLMDCPNNVEATFLCERYYLVHNDIRVLLKLNELIFGSI